MAKKVILLILANIVFIVGVVAIYAIGYEYDRAHELYPESDPSYHVVIEVYGKRWDRVAKTLLIFGVLADAAILLNWFRNRQAKRATVLDLGSNL